ncbi:MAG: BREX-1 system adenine-specific DNA-methyltransferase PglX [Exilispira sp.]|nr:BREX-1 system adenine-specific DNA-methyltransferase PglX [Exilispira sp.]
MQIEGKQKAPDYSFRIGGVRKFFVEAKKPSVYIKKEIDPAYQVRRYGYTAKLPLSILTNFEEFAVYDTRIKPSKDDDPSIARIFYCTYEGYENNFDFIYNTFSKNAILKGSFDKYIEENKNKKGTSEVDKELLKLVEEWRKELAKNIALRNNDIDIYNLNIAVQKIIDRIIFLRIAEDKDIEEYEQLFNITKGTEIYKNLNEIFIKANNKYNAGLFKSEEWLKNLTIEDKVLSTIIKSLYYPECPYEFSILPIEILGNIYEQFLGKTITFKNVKGGHTIIVEDKPEVKKAGGVYYTPQHIVNYIIQNSIGEKIKNKTPEEISKVKICDPACGSGSFLVAVYQYLLNYHLEYYTTEKNLKKALKEGKIYQISDKDYNLAIEEKQRILLNNIYGIDIDLQAVEVTKLSLYLKLLENEGKESKGFLFKHSDLKLLPDLDRNIKCGNSLIGNNFYKDKDLSLFDKDTMRKINAFDWEKEFEEIFKEGGFDIVIGNPPYIQLQKDYDGKQKYADLYEDKDFEVFDRMGDIYCLFYEKGIKILKQGGILGYITSNKWMRAGYGKKLRKFFLKFSPLKLIDLGPGVFESATVDTNILIIEKSENKNQLKATSLKEIKKIDNSKIEDILEEKWVILNKLTEDPWFIGNDTEQKLKEKIEIIGKHLKEWDVKIYRGILTFLFLGSGTFSFVM